MLYHVGGLAGKSNMEVSLKPEYENGIIFYIGARDDGRGDFASLALINGFVEFRYSGYFFIHLVYEMISDFLIQLP